MFESNHNKAFFLQRKDNEDTILYCTGQVVEYDSLDRLPIKKETDTDGKRVIDSISLIPFCQVKERGFVTHDADEKIKCISAASIIAKVYRDELMIKLSKKFKNYLWNKNFGYGTKEHLDGLKKHGASTIHRKNFNPIYKMLLK